MNKTENFNYGGFQELCDSGKWAQASSLFIEKAEACHSAKDYIDEMKFLILSFYIDMSGIEVQPFVNSKTVFAMQEACKLSGIGNADLEKLYRNSVKMLSLPHHSFSYNGCLRVLTYCAFGKYCKADKILQYLQKCLIK